MIQDLRYGFRILMKSPGFAIVAILTLGLGIGANSAIFSVVNAVLLNPFPYKDADRIMSLACTFEKESDTGAITYQDFMDWKKENKTFQSMAIARNYSFNLTGIEEPARVEGALVSAELIELLGVSPEIGRGFRLEEDREGADRAVIISHGIWERRFRKDPNIVQHGTIVLDGQTYSVIGVMPPRFKFWAADVWVPAGLNFDGDLHASRVARMGYFGVGRLKPGTTVAEARADLSLICKRLELAYPDSNKKIGAKVTPLKESVTSNIRPALLVLLGSVGFVLLIACANVANLLLARATRREKELAVRAALGAGRGRLVAQMMVESVPIAMLGGALGLGIAYAGLKALLVCIPAGSIPAEAVVGMDGRVLLFTVGMALATTILFGLIPAFQASKSGLSQSLNEGSRGGTGGSHSRGARNALVIAETALSLTLLAGAGLLIKSFGHLAEVKPGFKPDNVLQMQIALPIPKYPKPQLCVQFFDQALERLKTIPGVRTVGSNCNLPFSGSGMGMPVVLEGTHYQSMQDMPFTQYNMILGDYFSTLGIHLQAGRFFNDRDTRTSLPVAIINRTFAKKHFGDQDPIGKRVNLGLPDNLNREGVVSKGIVRFPWLTIVGVVDDIKHYGFTEEPQPQAYVPLNQAPEVPEIFTTQFLVVRTQSDPQPFIKAAREQIWAIDRDQPIAKIGLMTTLLSDTLKQPRFNMLLLGIFAVVALILASIGIYGVVSYSVSQRTREVGIRMALGARRRDVIKLVLREGMFLVGIGLAIGLATALCLSRVLKSLVFEINTADPLILGLMTLILATIGMLACYLPARRATRVDPMAALRHD